MEKDYKVRQTGLQSATAQWIKKCNNNGLQIVMATGLGCWITKFDKVDDKV